MITLSLVYRIQTRHRRPYNASKNTCTEVCTVSNYSAKATSLHASPAGPDDSSAGPPDTVTMYPDHPARVSAIATPWRRSQWQIVAPTRPGCLGSSAHPPWIGGVIVHLFSPVDACVYRDFSVNTITAAQSWYPMATGNFSMGEVTIVGKVN